MSTYRAMIRLREDLDRARMIADLARRREKLKRLRMEAVMKAIGTFSYLSVYSVLALY